MTAHTPGPWSVVRQGRNFHVNSDRSFVESEVAADARLIAAAPYLLRALAEIVSQINQGGSGGKVFARDHCIAAARAAIAKATGETK